MPPPEINLLTAPRGLVIAPAGCGKTQLIADALLRYEGDKPILILTHTNAGVVALRNRMDRAGIRRSKYYLTTIDGWAIRLINTFPLRSGHDPTIVTGQRPNYDTIRIAAFNLLKAKHINDVLSATYARIFVDECQDCSKNQFAIIYYAAVSLPTILMGDEMQAIFGFGNDGLADWKDHVCKYFPLLGELTTPWRWINADSEQLGRWLLQVRTDLQDGKGIDLRLSPEAVSWVQIDGGANDRTKLLESCRILAANNGGVLIIGDSTNPTSQRQFASQTPGAITVEAVDLRDLVAFANDFDLNSDDALVRIVRFAQSLMTNVGPTELINRINSLQKGTAKKPANDIETAAISFLGERKHSNVRTLLAEINKAAGVRVYRPDVLHCCIRALRVCDAGAINFHDAAIQMREQNRLLGRPLPKRAVGSTLLLKGLEAEVVVILNGDTLNAKNLYVALTRGAKRIVVCSKSPILGKAQ